MSARRCGHQISLRLVCCCYTMRGFQHCRHHLTESERAWKAELDKRLARVVSREGAVGQPEETA